MSQRKLLNGEVMSLSGSTGEMKIDDTFLTNLFGDTKDEIDGKLELGPTLLDITEGLKHVTQKKNDEDVNLIKYTIMLYINRGAINNAVQFLEIESGLPEEKEIAMILFEHLKYKLPGCKRLNKRKKDGIFTTRKYFGRDEDFYWLQIEEGHAFIYVGKSDGQSYRNNLSDAIKFIYRRDPQNKPSLF